METITAISGILYELAVARQQFKDSLTFRSASISSEMRTLGDVIIHT